MMYRSERRTIALAIAALGPFALAAGAGIGYLADLPAAPVVVASVLPVRVAPPTTSTTPTRMPLAPRRVAAPALPALTPPPEVPMTGPRHAAPDPDTAPMPAPTTHPASGDVPPTTTAPSHTSAPATTMLPAPTTPAAPVTPTVPPSGSPIYDTLRAENLANLMHVPAP